MRHHSTITILAFLLLSCTVTGLQAQSFTLLHTFTGQDGEYPASGVTLDGGGNLYGTTTGGGVRGVGTVYQLKRNRSDYTLNVLYSFLGGLDGWFPGSDVVFGPDGRLYGTTEEGGLNWGVVFSLRPPVNVCKSQSCRWTEAVLHTFQGNGSDGGSPMHGKLAFDPAGNMYGTTADSGSYEAGTAYKLARSGDTWTESVLYNFGNVGDGSIPYYNVILDHAGNLYGTNISGGAYGQGTLFQLVPSSSGWSENILLNFPPPGLNLGMYPAALIMDQAGNLYGTTGENNGQAGTVFELSPSSNGWQLNVLYRFTSGPPAGPSGVVMDSSGNLYGTTCGDGLYQQGNVFKLTRSGSSWTYADLYDFSGQADGSCPNGELAIDASGSLYGTCSVSSLQQGYGTVWKITQ